MMSPAYWNWPLRMPACTTGEITLPNSAPAKKNLKSERLPTPVPQLANGPYSQLLSSRISATAFAPFGSAIRDWAAATTPAVRRNKKSLMLAVNLGSFREAVLLLSKKGRHNRAALGYQLMDRAQPATCSICSASMSKFE